MIHQDSPEQQTAMHDGPLRLLIAGSQLPKSMRSLKLLLKVRYVATYRGRRAQRTQNTQEARGIPQWLGAISWCPIEASERGPTLLLVASCCGGVDF
eukprot:gnl/TRDRNA2_/TRDRNA2_88682_c1_seq1.p1 gnl/TRDRNA2_/TRDRNA2_88682_c1~~gnl/TRDRNA2_/TRDRNA2_88682_c1_seq1.p1  ORF type:complete len:104 (+),score=10.04 gnl/TRDRNA2_/TRDRNA2_88682_c1_seq1:24-314(+)